MFDLEVTLLPLSLDLSLQYFVIDLTRLAIT